MMDEQAQVVLLRLLSKDQYPTMFPSSSLGKGFCTKAIQDRRGFSYRCTRDPDHDGPHCDHRVMVAWVNRKAKYGSS